MRYINVALLLKIFIMQQAKREGYNSPALAKAVPNSDYSGSSSILPLDLTNGKADPKHLSSAFMVESTRFLFDFLYYEDVKFRQVR